MLLCMVNVVWWILAPLLRIKLYWRARKEPLYGFAIAERYGRYPQPAPPRIAPIWVHAVSLGETRAITPFVQRLLADGLPVLLTHMTATGRAEGQRTFATAIQQQQLQQAWLPYDTPAAVQRFYTYFQPRCGLLVETEVWPNLVRIAARRQIPMALVNARISPRSFRRLQRFQSSIQPIYACLSQILAQTPLDAERFQQVLGDRVPITMTGNMKFDGAVQPELQAKGRLARQAQGNRPVIAIASTREGEEALFIAALEKCQQTLQARPFPLWLLIPRHPQRFEEVGQLLEQSTLSYTLRSQLVEGVATIESDILLGDSIGEMGFYYSWADFAIIGGGFLPLGGQNHIEAAHYGCPVCVGPHTTNFTQAVLDAVSEGAAIQVEQVDSAIDFAVNLLQEDGTRLAQMQAATERFIARHAGAVNKTYQALQPYLLKE